MLHNNSTAKIDEIAYKLPYPVQTAEKQSLLVKMSRPLL